MPTRTEVLGFDRRHCTTGKYEVFRLGQPEQACRALSATGAGDYTQLRLGKTDLRDRVAFAKTLFVIS